MILHIISSLQDETLQAVGFSYPLDIYRPSVDLASASGHLTCLIFNVPSPKKGLVLPDFLQSDLNVTSNLYVTVIINSSRREFDIMCDFVHF